MKTQNNLICIKCNGEDFNEKADAVIEQIFKGDLLKIVSPAMECKNCGELALRDAQIDALRILAADEYRKKHNLLDNMSSLETLNPGKKLLK